MFLETLILKYDSNKKSHLKLERNTNVDISLKPPRVSQRKYLAEFFAETGEKLPKLFGKVCRRMWN